MSLEANGGQDVAAYALVWGQDLDDLASNAEAAMVAYNPVAALTEQAPVKVFRLDQNQPNPFNPSTTIGFSLRRTSLVKLRVYDVAGRLVRTLHDGELAAGHHAVAWDGRDGDGRRVQSGTFLYRLESAEGVLCRKMVLMK